MSGTRIRILLVDDHILFRKGIAHLLVSQPDFDLVGEAGNGREAIQKAEALSPDVVLMDLAMPDVDGLEATRQILARSSGTRIVILTFSEEDENLFEAVKSGARGYLLKKIAPEDLFANIRTAARGEASISGGMARKLLDEFSSQAKKPVPRSEGPALTPREREVLQLLAKGKSNKEISALLFIAENTVKNHMRSILEKLHLENRVQAAAYALRNQMRDPEEV